MSLRNQMTAVNSDMTLTYSRYHRCVYIEVICIKHFVHSEINDRCQLRNDVDIITLPPFLICRGYFDIIIDIGGVTQVEFCIHTHTACYPFPSYAADSPLSIKREIELKN